MRHVSVVVMSLCLSLAATGALVSHFQFEGNLQDSVGANHGTAIGAVGFAPSSLAGGSQCLDLTAWGGVDGGYGVVLEGTEYLFNSPQAITVALWCRAVVHPGDARWEALVSKIGPSMTAWDMQGWSARMYNDSKNLAFTTRLDGAGGYGYTSGLNIRDGNWHHVVVTFQAGDATNDSVARIYINGNLERQNIAVGKQLTDTSTIPISIGVALDDWGFGFDYKDGWYGYINDVRLYDHVMDATEVAALFETTATVPTVMQNPESLTVWPGDTAVFAVVGGGAVSSYTWYKSDDPNPTPATDTPVGTGDTLTIPNVQVSHEGYYYCVLGGAMGDATSSVASLMLKRQVAHWEFENSLADSIGGHDGAKAATNYVAGVVGDALSIVRAEEQAVFVPYSSELNTEAFTFTTWVKTPGSPGNAMGIYSSRATSGNQGGISLWIGGTGLWTYQLRTSTGGTTNVSGGAVVENEWNHVALTFEPTGVSGANLVGTAAIYINGELISQNTSVVHSPNTNTAIDYILGALQTSTNPAYNFLDGLLDDVRHYNYALSGREVAQLYVDVTGVPMCFPESPYDFNTDCKVDLLDFAMFAREWLDDSWVYPSGN